MLGLTGSFYLSKLLFSPNASQPGRILIAQAVHNTDDYAKCISPYKGRPWPDAMLRFDVIEEANPPRVPASVALTEVTECSVNTPDSFFQINSQEPNAFTPSSFVIPPPPVLFSTPPAQPATMESHTHVDTPGDSHNCHLHSTVGAAPRRGSSSSECCSLAQSKVEIQDLVETFQTNLDHLLNRTFGRSLKVDTSRSSELHASPPIWATSPISNPFQSSPPSLSCGLCTNALIGRWYTCSDCHARVVSPSVFQCCWIY